MDTLDTTELLALLRDIHLPAAPTEPSVWPVLLCVALIVAATVVLISRHWRQNSSWAVQAIAELDEIQRNAEPTALLQLAALLKRIAITHDKRTEVKHLQGMAWLEYLDHFFGSRYFTKGNGQIFGYALYRHGSHQSEGQRRSLYRELRKQIRRRKWQA